MIVGTRARLTCLFKNFQQVLTDPDAVVVKIEAAGQTAQTFAPSRASVGSWFYDYLPPAAGRYLVRWEGTGAVQASGEMTLVVNPSLLI